MSSPADPELRDAVEFAPPGEGDPKPQVLVYATGHKPVVRVRVAGHWRTAVVRERHDYGHGRTAYRVILDPGTGTHVVRTYWWSPGMQTLLTPPK
ncbi:hypothetical protein [Streptacidiphilus carbonis]|uniref:hypothetical protein n=1 Tax=Streptacidiphilus carbonis TaxID=105422 RepID=UPI0005A84550|nr:hypothetical protein [Streptacidiphilus carbonis]